MAKQKKRAWWFVSTPDDLELEHQVNAAVRTAYRLGYTRRRSAIFGRNLFKRELARYDSIFSLLPLAKKPRVITTATREERKQKWYERLFGRFFRKPQLAT